MLARIPVASVDVGAVVEAYEDLVRRILARPARLGRTRLVAIDGPSGAGKTVFAARLAQAFGTVFTEAAAADPDVDGTPPVVHTDDLLNGWGDQFSFWPRLDDWVLAPLRVGRAGRYRRYDWVRCAFDPEWIPVPPAPVLLLEGVSSARAVIRPEVSFAVYVTAPPRLRLARALVRDGDAVGPYLQRWRRAEQAHFDADATARHVDLIVDGAPGPADDPAAGYLRLPGKC